MSFLDGWFIFGLSSKTTAKPSKSQHSLSHMTDINTFCLWWCIVAQLLLLLLHLFQHRVICGDTSSQLSAWTHWIRKWTHAGEAAAGWGSNPAADGWTRAIMWPPTDKDMEGSMLTLIRDDLNRIWDNMRHISVCKKCKYIDRTCFFDFFCALIYKFCPSLTLC